MMVLWSGEVLVMTIISNISKPIGSRKFAWFFFGSERGSGSHSIRLSIRVWYYAILHTIFIILVQIFKQSLSGLSVVSQQSLSNLSAVSQWSLSGYSTVSLQSLGSQPFLIKTSGPKILCLVKSWSLLRARYRKLVLTQICMVKLHLHSRSWLMITIAFKVIFRMFPNVSTFLILILSISSRCATFPRPGR